MITDNFKIFYETTFKPAAIKCAPLELFRLMQDIENNGHEPTEEEVDKLNTFHDSVAIWYVGKMLANINDTLHRDFFSLNALNSIGQIDGVLKEENSYWTNIWKTNRDSEEYKNLKALASLMPELLQKLN